MMALINGEVLEAIVRDDRQQLVHSDGQHIQVSPLQLDGNSCHRSLKAGQEGLMVVIISSICFAVSVTVALILTIYLGPPQVPPHGGVVSDSKICSELGVKLLQNGGSAVDAAIATSLCVGLVYPENCGIGGGGIMLIRSHKANSTDVIDFLDAAPENVVKASVRKVGVESIAVPGLLLGFKHAHDNYGKLSWKELILTVVKQFMGTISHDMSELLTKIADEGVDGFYSEEVATVVQVHSDIENYQTLEHTPVSTTFFDNTIETVSSTTDGPVLLTLLNIVEYLILNGTTTWNSTEFYHYVLEAMKMAYAAHSQVTEVDDVVSFIARTISKEYAAVLASKIDRNSTHGYLYYEKATGSKIMQPLFNNEKTATSQVSVIGTTDVMVSVAMTLGDIGGSGVKSHNGFYWNNHLAYIQSNTQVVEGKRLRAPVTPVIVYATLTPCAQRIAFGGCHGSWGAAAAAEFLMNIVGMESSLAAAVNAGRIYSQVSTNDEIFYDDGTVPSGIINMLKSKGHSNFIKLSAGSNTVNVISKSNEIVTGQTDLRNSNNNASFY